MSATRNRLARKAVPSRRPAEGGHFCAAQNEWNPKLWWLTSMNLAPAASSSTGNSTFWPSGMVSTAMPSCRNSPGHQKLLVQLVQAVARRRRSAGAGAAAARPSQTQFPAAAPGGGCWAARCCRSPCSQLRACCTAARAARGGVSRGRGGSSGGGRGRRRPPAFATGPVRCATADPWCVEAGETDSKGGGASPGRRRPSLPARVGLTNPSRQAQIRPCCS